MWTYSTNNMGPMLHWYEKNNIPYVDIPFKSELLKKEGIYRKYLEHYIGGRIDCYCNDITDPDYSPYNQEQILPIMEADEAYYMFEQWLSSYLTNTYDPNVVDTFERSTGIILNIKEH